MNLVGVKTIVPRINYTITKMEFTSINVRMMFPNMEIVILCRTAAIRHAAHVYQASVMSLSTCCLRNVTCCASSSLPVLN